MKRKRRKVIDLILLNVCDTGNACYRLSGLFTQAIYDFNMKLKIKIIQESKNCCLIQCEKIVNNNADFGNSLM